MSILPRLGSYARGWREQPPPSIRTLWTIGCAILFCLYTVVIMAALQETLLMAMRSAAANVLPLAVLSAATREILKTSVMPRPIVVQAVAHAALAVGFAVTWYALVVLLLAFMRGLAGAGFAIDAFRRPAFVWQMFQGVMLYVTVAAVCYAIRGGRETANVTIMTAPPLDRYLTRVGDQMVPIDVRDIVSITGAQDYAEVATLGGSLHLVRMSLNEFEQRLDTTSFIRVHRSTIVNFRHLARAEPAGGGRMLAHMANGEAVQVSRAGAQLLRTLVV